MADIIDNKAGLLLLAAGTGLVWKSAKSFRIRTRVDIVLYRGCIFVNHFCMYTLDYVCKKHLHSSTSHHMIPFVNLYLVVDDYIR